MSRLYLGLLAGAIFGALSVASMLPLAFADKQSALLGAFLNRFAIGAALTPCSARCSVPSRISDSRIAARVTAADRLSDLAALRPGK